MAFSDSKNKRLLLAGIVCFLAVLAIGIWNVATSSAQLPAAPAIEAVGDSPSLGLRDEELQARPALHRTEFPSNARTELEAEPHAISSGSNSTTVSVTIQIHESPRIPVVGAQVLVRANSETFTGSTDSEGEVTFQLPPSNERLIIETTAPGFFHGRHLRSLTSFIRALAYREVIVTGRVLDEETRKPVQATLRYVHGRCERVCSPEELLCDAGGRFELSATNDIKSAGLWVSAPGYASFHARGPRKDEADYEILITRGFEIRGKVIDITNQAPVPGAKISSSDGMHLKTDELGEFVGRIRLDTEKTPPRPAHYPPPGAISGRPAAQAKQLSLTVTAPGFVSVGMKVNSSTLGLSTKLSLPLLRSTSVFGSVSTEDGVPLAGVDVYLTGSPSEGEATRVLRDASLAPVVVRSANNAEYTPRGITDLAGEFRIDGILPWSESGSLSPKFEGQALADPQPIATGNPGSSQEVRLIVAEPKPRSVEVTGKFTFLGKPHPGWIWWSTKTDRGGATADETGEYWFFSSPGKTSITATPNLDFANLYEALGYVDVRETVEEEFEAERTYRVNFEIDLEMGVIAGTVQSTAGNPVSQLQIGVSGMSDESLVWASTRTDEGGEFSSTLQPDQAGYKISIHWGERRFIFPNLHVGDPPLEIVLPETVGIALRVRDSETGVPIPDIFVGQRKPNETIYLSRNFIVSPCEGDEPDLLCSEVIDDPHELVVSATGYVAKELGLIDYTDGLIIDVQLDPAPWTEIRLAASFEPLPAGTRIFLLEEGYGHVLSTSDWSQFQMGRAGRARDSSLVNLEYANNRALIEGFAPGTYRFHSSPPGLIFEPATIQLSRGSAENVRLNYTAED